MKPSRTLLIPWLAGFLSRLRFPQLFVITTALFLVDLAIPDLIPFADELLLAVLAVLFGMMKRRVEERSAAGSSASSDHRRE